MRGDEFGLHAVMNDGEDGDEVDGAGGGVAKREPPRSLIMKLVDVRAKGSMRVRAVMPMRR